MLSEGYVRREELKWVHTREIMTMINNSSEYCKNTTPQKIKPLRLDEQNEIDETQSISLFEKMVKE